MCSPSARLGGTCASTPYRSVRTAASLSGRLKSTPTSYPQAVRALLDSTVRRRSPFVLSVTTAPRGRWRRFHAPPEHSAPSKACPQPPAAGRVPKATFAAGAHRRTQRSPARFPVAAQRDRLSIKPVAGTSRRLPALGRSARTMASKAPRFWVHSISHSPRMAICLSLMATGFRVTCGSSLSTVKSPR